MRARIPEDESPFDVKIGDADVEFLFDSTSTPQHSSDTSQLPPTQTLQSRLSAYNSLNARLAAHVSSLKARDGELEAKYRRVIALCTGVEEKQVDSVLAQLVQAVESEVDPGQDVCRVREFLRRVEMVI
jgi:regulatory protein SWI6